MLVRQLLASTPIAPEKSLLHLNPEEPYWRDGRWYVGRLKGIPGVFSQGRTVAELEENIRDAYRTMLEDADETLPDKAVRAKQIGIEA